MADNIINAVFGSGICAVTTSAFRANYGMVLRFSGIDLPTAFECDFSNYDTSNNDSITAIGQNGEVQIPDQLWESGLNIYAYVYLHPTDDSGVTVYTVTIPVLGRPNRTEETPTPHEQTLIEQAISALNDAVEQTAADVETTTANAQAAAQSEANAATSERSAAASAGAALASQNAAESASQSATESASGAAESARNAANSAAQAAESATDAQESAEQAERSVQSISGDVERAERAATTATNKANEAASSASTASGKASEASASATAAAQSAQSAASAAQNAASSAQSAESSATDAEQAKQDAQDAKEAAETARDEAVAAVESVADKAAQITQNTADIAELVQSKAGVLVDTASGSIASFVPDATVPTVRGLTVNVEPVQDLHGYDNPWPAGGGVNVVDFASYFTEGETATQNGITAVFSKGYLKVTGTNTSTTFNIVYKNSPVTLPAGTYIMPYNINVRASVDGGENINYANAITAESSVEIKNFYVFAGSGATVNYNIPMMLVKGTTRPTAYAPYSNICPISGWDEVSVPRTGINLFDYRTVRTATINGVTLTNNNDGTLTLNGTATADAFFDVFNAQFGAEPLAERTYTLSGCPNGGGSNSYFLYIRPNYMNDYGNGKTFTQAVVGGSLFVKQRQTLNNLIFRPQIELGSSVSDFKPYQGDTYQIQLGQTVYGGTIDVTNGVLTVTHGVKVLDGSETWYWSANNNLAQAVVQNGVVTNGVTQYNSYTQNSTFTDKSWAARSSVDGSIGMFYGASAIYAKYSKFTTAAEVKAFFAENPTTVVYELATPITISLTPIEVAVLTGQTNNIWADSGDVSVEYAADLKTYIDNKIAAAVAALS